MNAAIFRKVFSGWEYRILAVAIFLFFAMFYLYSTQFILVGTKTTNGTGFLLIPEWRSLMFRQRTPFIFEAIAVIRAGGAATFFVSVPNVLIASVLGALVSLNSVLSYFLFRSAGLRGAKGALTLVGTIPALLSGAACCTPAIVAVIGLQLTGLVATAWPWTIPISMLILSASLWWSLKQARRFAK